MVDSDFATGTGHSHAGPLSARSPVLEAVKFCAKYLIFLTIGIAALCSTFGDLFTGHRPDLDVVLRFIKDLDLYERTISNRSLLWVTGFILLYSLLSGKMISRDHQSYSHGFVVGASFYPGIALGLASIGLVVAILLGLIWLMHELLVFFQWIFGKLSVVLGFIAIPFQYILALLWQLLLPLLVAVGEFLIQLLTLVGKLVSFLLYPIKVVVTWLFQLIAVVLQAIFSYVLSPLFWYVIVPLLLLCGAAIVLFLLNPISASGKSFVDSARALIRLDSNRPAMFSQGVTVGIATFITSFACFVGFNKLDDPAGIFDKFAVAVCILHLLISIRTAGRVHSAVSLVDDFRHYTAHNRQEIMAFVMAFPLMAWAALPYLASWITPSDES